ncbi:GntR family transcriptional regulator [Candidatus Obscuribacterales bacterium]|nr:GntR family transcriptional regulator [Candidatus Obscuribacterales bacterium]MBX3137492.1 GntR family transcriptional regulator [Candidatus Obscuribacterales bacterium]MBX3154187.1 GntR family transcriptional regulator [Candidatus Obscuribacterales bacterium]
MKISINKDSSVPVRDQLVEQVSLQIASGLLTPKEKLPSIRALAARLGIHYSTVTAAYNHLADVGLLDIRQGSGVRVASINNRENEPAAKSSLDSMINDFLARASEAGFAAADVMNAVEKLKERKPVRRILAVDRNEDFHRVLLTELKPHFKIPVEACTVQDIMDKPEQMDDSLILTSLYHLFTFQDKVKDRTRLVPCNIEPASLEMEKIATLRAGSLVLLVSVSETLMNMATKLVAAHRGEEIPVRAVLLSDEKELNYMVNHANLILCDSPSEDTVRKIADPKILQVFKLYPPSTIKLIQERLSKWG